MIHSEQDPAQAERNQADPFLEATRETLGVQNPALKVETLAALYLLQTEMDPCARRIVRKAGNQDVKSPRQTEAIPRD